MAVVAHPAADQDPRCQVGAFVHNGRDLFQVLAAFTPDGSTELWLRLENTLTLHGTDYLASEVADGHYFRIVDWIPDFPPEP